MVTGLIVLCVTGMTMVSAQYRQGRYYQPGDQQLAYTPGVFQITPFGGFMMGDEYDAMTGWSSRYGRIIQDDSAVWGLRLGFGLVPNVGLEFQYSHADTAFYTSRGGSLFDTRQKLSDVDVHIFLANVNFDFVEGDIVPYFAVGMGTTLYDVKSGRSDTEFTGTLAGGIKARMAPNIALRFEVRGYITQVRDTMYSTYWNGDYYYWESYNDAYLSTWDSTLGISFML